MNNVQKLTELGVIEVIRLRMGVSNGQDTSSDDVINQMSPDELVRNLAAWYLGDDTCWWYEFKKVYDALNQQK